MPSSRRTRARGSSSSSRRRGRPPPPRPRPPAGRSRRPSGRGALGGTPAASARGAAARRYSVVEERVTEQLHRRADDRPRREHRALLADAGQGEAEHRRARREQHPLQHAAVAQRLHPAPWRELGEITRHQHHRPGRRPCLRHPRDPIAAHRRTLPPLAPGPFPEAGYPNTGGPQSAPRGSQAETLVTRRWASGSRGRGPRGGARSGRPVPGAATAGRWRGAAVRVALAGGDGRSLRVRGRAGLRRASIVSFARLVAARVGPVAMVRPLACPAAGCRRGRRRRCASLRSFIRTSRVLTSIVRARRRPVSERWTVD